MDRFYREHLRRYRLLNDVFGRITNKSRGNERFSLIGAEKVSESAPFLLSSTMMTCQAISCVYSDQISPHSADSLVTSGNG